MNYQRQVLFAMLLTFGSAAYAECPTQPKKYDCNLSECDQRVTDAFLTKLLSGKKLRLGGGVTENYLENGDYFIRAMDGGLMQMVIGFIPMGPDVWIIHPMFASIYMS